MPSLISLLSKAQQCALLEDLNYLNMGEIKTVCKKYSIPYAIWVETKDNGRRKTADEDRKGIILNRIRHYLRTGKIQGPTCFSARVVCSEGLPKNLKATDRLFYGQYDKKSGVMVGLLKKLTEGEFKDGAVARILVKEFWSKGKAPTYREYALAWLKATQNHKRPNPEWAFLSDRVDGKEIENWKRLRNTKAKQVLNIAKRLEHARPN